MLENIYDKSLYTTTREKWAVFFFVFMGVSSLTYGFLYIIDFLPEQPLHRSQIENALMSEVIEQLEVEASVGTITVISDIDNSVSGADEPTASNEESTITEAPEVLEREPAPVFEGTNPILVRIPSLGKEITVLNPESRSIAALDTALLSGVVRHPDSADFENEGTIFLFGHSSYLPRVINKNFQAFNGLKELGWGDKVYLQSNNTEYVYRVERVYQVQASNAEVEIVSGEPRLTLVTCNTFGSKDDRFIVEAELVDQYHI